MKHPTALLLALTFALLPSCAWHRRGDTHVTLSRVAAAQVAHIEAHRYQSPTLPHDFPGEYIRLGEVRWGPVDLAAADQWDLPKNIADQLRMRALEQFGDKADLIVAYPGKPGIEVSPASNSAWLESRAEAVVYERMRAPEPDPGMKPLTPAMREIEVHSVYALDESKDRFTADLRYLEMMFCENLPASHPMHDSVPRWLEDEFRRAVYEEHGGAVTLIVYRESFRSGDPGRSDYEVSCYGPWPW